MRAGDAPFRFSPLNRYLYCKGHSANIALQSGDAVHGPNSGSDPDIFAAYADEVVE